MNNNVYLLWFVKEMPKGVEDIELLIAVYSSDAEAKEAVERVKDKPGIVEFQAGFQIHSYQLNRESWTEGFIVD